MKRCWIACVILLALLSATLLHGRSISDLTGELITLLEQAEAYAENGDWTSADTLTGAAAEKWKARERYLHITLHHEETDAVKTALKEAAEFIQCHDRSEYSAANARLVARLELMAEAERLSWDNVL